MRAYSMTLILTLCAGLALASPASAQVQSVDQQKCITSVNKAATKLSRTVRKTVAGCLKEGERGRLGSQSVLDCVLADAKARISKGQQKVTDAEAKRCPQVPGFASPGAAAVNAAVMSEQMGLAADVFGAELTGAPTADGSSCRSSVAKASGKFIDTMAKQFLACKKDGLKTATIDSAAALALCLDDVLADANGKIGATRIKVGGAAAKSCNVTTVGSQIPGECGSSAGVIAFSTCLYARLQCRYCLETNAVDDINGDCDLFDDGVANLSCPPGIIPTTTSSTTTTSTSTTSTSTTTSTTSTSTTSTTSTSTTSTSTTTTSTTNTTTTTSTTTTTLPACASASAPTCGGLCAVGEACTDLGGTCGCVPTTTTTTTSTTSSTTTSTTTTTSTSTTSTTSTTLPACETTGAPTCNGTCNVGEICVDFGGACTCAPDWPAVADDYVTGPVSYLNTVQIPPLDGGGVPTCCKDFGSISKNAGTDNALARLASQLTALGVDLGAILSTAVQDGSLVILLDHQALDSGALPDDFALAQLQGSFDAGTTYTEANAGTGNFLVSRSSFVGTTGEPLNYDFPASMGTTAMSAGPFTFSLTLPLGFVTLDLQAFEAEINGDHGVISVSGVPYANGEIAAYVLIDDIFIAINSLLNSSQCSCLGLGGSVYNQQPNGTWTASCVATAGLCTLPGEEVCKTLAGNSLLGTPQEVCLVLPGVLQNQADLDLNSDPTRYEGMSIGLQFTGTTATVTGLEP